MAKGRKAESSQETPDTAGQEPATLINMLAKLGVSADGEDGDRVKLTLVQYGKLAGIMSDGVTFMHLLAAENRVVVEISRDLLEAAVDTGKRAPRAAVNVEIVSRMVYSVIAPDSPNRIDTAWWEAESNQGNIGINGVIFPIEPALARDYYDVSEEPGADTDPDRKIYVVRLVLDKSGDKIFTSYGVTNLIRRIAAIREVIIG